MKRQLLISISACMMLSLASCSTFQKNVKTEAQLPDDRTTIGSTVAADTYRSQPLERGEIAGDWAIETVDGQKAIGETAPYLRFDSKTGRIYGNNGCNTLNANYKAVTATKELRFSDIITTMRACADSGITETQINLALDATAYYDWSRQGSQYRLTLYSAEHKPVMTLLHQDYDFLNGAWAVDRIGDKKISNDEMKLVFDIEEMKVHGNTGCNIMNGSLVTDMLEPAAISFQNMATTRRMCPDIQLETELLVALEAAVSVKPVNANTVNFLDNQGAVILQLARAAE